MTDADIVFLERLAERLSAAIYYGKVDAIGNGSVSPGLLNDDYDRLRAIAKEGRRANLQAQLAALDAGVGA